MECKALPLLLRSAVRSVLIETLWNVKELLLPSLPADLSINRNIMECKVSRYTEVGELLTVLIETLWNVKMSNWH